MKSMKKNNYIKNIVTTILLLTAPQLGFASNNSEGMDENDNTDLIQQPVHYTHLTDAQAQNFIATVHFVYVHFPAHLTLQTMQDMFSQCINYTPQQMQVFFYRILHPQIP